MATKSSIVKAKRKNLSYSPKLYKIMNFYLKFHTFQTREVCWSGALKALIIMKLALFLNLLFIMQLYAKVDAQTVTLSCEKASIKEIFKEINQQTGYEFLYNSQMIERAKPVSAKFNESPIKEVLTHCFASQPFSFVIEGKTIVVTPKPSFQKQIIKGVVSDKSGNPLPSTNVHIKGSLSGTVTGAHGEYSIEVPANSTLVFSFVGFKSKEILISDQTQLNVILEEEEFELGELTFYSTGYQKIKPEQSTGSLSQIKSKEFETRVNTTDFLIGLQNKIPGLLINNDVQFEDNSLFQIRGVSTIYGNKQPLIVIDGYPTELSLDMVNPNEIESITVLKDAAAATVYGARSSNGVIIIERKKAAIGKPRINFRSTLSITPKENYSRYRWDKEGSKTITEWEKINTKSLVAANAWDLMNSATGDIYNYNAAVDIIAHWKSPTEPISTEERDRELAQLATINNAKEYSSLFLRPAVAQTYNLDISGGNENIRYYITTNYTDENQTVITNNNSLFRLSARTDIAITPKFSLELTSDFNSRETKTSPLVGINNLFPFERLQDSGGNPLAVYQGSQVGPRYNNYLMSNGLLDNRYYPLQEINEVSDKVTASTNRITANFRYKIIDELSLSFGGVYESYKSLERHLATNRSSEARQYINRYTTGSGANIVNNIPNGGFLKEQNGSKEGYTLRAQLNYDKELATEHTLNLILGSEIREIVDRSSTTSYFGYDDNTLFSIPVDFKFIEVFNPVYSRYNRSVQYSNLFNQKYSNNRFVSFYSNLVYSYKRKYSATASVRVDQSNLFGTNPKYKYRPLWSVGAAWNVHKEEFMQDIYQINSMKLRVAYGFNGNVAKNAIPQVIAVSGLNSVTPNELTPMLSLFSYANSGLRWEQTKNLNTGLDLQLFNRVNLSFDYYLKKSIDILATNQIDATKGGNSALINEASIENRGFEIDLNADWITKRRFNWNSGLIFSRNSSKVLSVYNPNIIPTTSSKSYLTGSYANYLEGYAVGAIFALRDAGVNNEGQLLTYDKEGNAKIPFTKDEGRDELNYLGSSIPVYNAGFSNRIDIGNSYLYFMVHYYGGFNVRVPSPNVWADRRPLEGAANYWKVAGDELKEGVLPFPNHTNTTYLTYTDKYTVKGSYITLGDVTFSHSFRDLKAIRGSKINNIELRAQASNVYTIGFNKYNFSKATRSFEKSYITPTYTLGLYLNF